MPTAQKTSPAKGARGFLLRSVDKDGRTHYFFRVYDADHSFRDYMLVHSDLEVQIIDEEATFYEAEGESEARLDHAPRTLGYEK